MVLQTINRTQRYLFSRMRKLFFAIETKWRVVLANANNYNRSPEVFKKKNVLLKTTCMLRGDTGFRFHFLDTQYILHRIL